MEDEVVAYNQEQTVVSATLSNIRKLSLIIYRNFLFARRKPIKTMV